MLEDDGDGFPFLGRHDMVSLKALGVGPTALLQRVARRDGTLVVDSRVAGSRVEIALPLGTRRSAAAGDRGHTGGAMSIRLVLADDHPFILDALEGLFRLEEDIEVVARCADGLQAIDAVKKHEPDVLILDMRMPGANGLAVMRALRDLGSQTRVVLLAGAVSDRELVECLRLGVRGVVLKEMAPAKLVQCVRKVYAGHVWVEQQSITQAVDLMLRREAGRRELAEQLTRREIEIVTAGSRGTPQSGDRSPPHCERGHRQGAPSQHLREAGRGRSHGPAQVRSGP